MKIRSANRIHFAFFFLLLHPFHFPYEGAPEKKKASTMSDAVVIKGAELSALGADLGSLEKLPAKAKGAAGGFTKVNLSFNSLTGDSLGELAQFTSLETLILDNNDIQSLAQFPPLPHLTTLWLNKNCLDDIQAVLTVLSRTCPRLTYLSLLGNPCAPSELTGASEAEYSRYRILVKHRFPTLQYLDAAPFTPKEVETAREKGKFYETATVAPKVASNSPTAGARNPSPTQGAEGGADAKATPAGSVVAGSQAKKPDDDDEEDLFAKVVQERDQSNTSGAYFSKQQQFYSGKSSEGNRFIKDDAL